jgi:hypothetical protein
MIGSLFAPAKSTTANTRAIIFNTFNLISFSEELIFVNEVVGQT